MSGMIHSRTSQHLEVHPVVLPPIVSLPSFLPHSTAVILFLKKGNVYRKFVLFKKYSASFCSDSPFFHLSCYAERTSRQLEHSFILGCASSACYTKFSCRLAVFSTKTSAASQCRCVLSMLNTHLYQSCTALGGRTAQTGLISPADEVWWDSDFSGRGGLHLGSKGFYLERTPFLFQI